MEDFEQTPLCKLFISDLRLWARLGCTDEEKHHPQLVSLNIEFTFASPPLGLVTDQLEDTVCYVEAVQSIQNLCANKKFNLIESLAYEVHKTIVHMLGSKKESIALVKVEVQKKAPPVPGVHGGIHFTYSDSPRGDTL